MVRFEYGFNGYQVPPTPRAARSARRRCLFKRKADDSQMCAFDVLATVAGKLLLDGETANTSSGKEQFASVEDPIDKEDNAKPLEHKSCGRGYYERNFLITELVSDANPHYCPNELSCAQNDETSRPASGITSSDSSDKAVSVEHLVNDDCKLRLGIFSSSVDDELSGFRVSANSGSEGENRKRVKVGSAVTKNVSIGNKPSLCGSGDHDDWDRKPPAFVSSFDCVKFPLCKDDSPSGSFPVIRDHVKLVTKDDDENSSECNELITRYKAFKPPPHFGDGKFWKFPASKECKITPGTKDGKPYNADVERCNYFNRKTALKSQRSVRDYPFKKRKLFVSDSLSNSGERTNCNGISQVSENRSNGGGLGSSPAVPAAMAIPTSPRGGHTSFQSRNTQVKLKIKSFRVPELLIEMPETATVGSLKEHGLLDHISFLFGDSSRQRATHYILRGFTTVQRTVLKAITTVLGGGLRVGVVLQGKKIRDDNKTLLQAGISQDSKMDSLGFSLEPSLAPVPLRSYPDTRPVQLTPDKPQALARCPPPPVITQNSIQHGDLDSSPDVACSSSFNNFIESDHDSAPSPTGMSLHRRNTDSKALVPSSATKPEALYVMPLRKCKRSESTQRRIRRPFTVAEVESLVQAVEKLGTGRWRDVKLRAFDNAKHRTYVDLKDKWKTLVHTARISPQQRRGEPVPQELLDRVLTAHAYWSQQQAKHQLKAQPDTCLLL